MQVVGSYMLIEQKIKRLGHLVGMLSPLRLVILICGIFAWVFLVGLVLWSDHWRFASHVVTAAAGLSIVALGLPRLVDALSAEAEGHAKQVSGGEKLSATLAQMLDAEWTLYQNCKLPSQTNTIDAILLGPNVIYLLEIVVYAAVYQNSGSKWLRRASDDSWQLVDTSPTDETLTKSAQLAEWLREQGIEIKIQPRIVWAEGGLILQEEPDVPFWLLNQAQAIKDELRRGMGEISAETRPQLVTLLETLTSDAAHTEKLSTKPLLS